MASPAPPHLSLTIFVQNILGLPFINIHHRLSTIANTIHTQNPDIILLQEVNLTAYIKFFQILDLKYQLFYSPSKLINQGGLLTLVNKKYSVSDFKFTKYKNQGNIFSLQLTDQILKKGYQSLCLKDLGICLINTHLVTCYFTPNNPDSNHSSQIKQLSQFITYQKTKNLIIGGDFNFTPDTNSYYQFLKNQKLVDISASLNPSVKQIFTKVKLDYIFLKCQDYQTTSIKYLPSSTFVSDHPAIISTITFSPLSPHPIP